MPNAMNGTYVYLPDLKRYLSLQYKGMGGAAIASHRHFCDHIPGRVVETYYVGKSNGSAKGGATMTYVWVPLSSIAAYLTTQYGRHMNGRAIASHRSFLRNVPRATFTA